MNQGTSRNERALESLNPANFKLDGRSLSELYEETKIFAKTVSFEDADVSKNWEAFFEEGLQYIELIQGKSLESILLKNCPPHLGLFLAFLQLFQSVQDQFNSLSRSHLKLFYQKILGQKVYGLKEDHAYIFFELARNTAKLHLEKGTEMLAGKDSDNNNLIYRTDKDIFLNKARVAECKAIYNGKGNNDSIYAYDNVAEIQELLGGTISQNETIPGNGWYPFGNPSLLRKSAAIGFGVSSPILELKEGKRSIRVRLTIDEINREVFTNKLESSAMEAYITTAEGWLAKPIEKINTDGNTILFEIILEKLDPPIQAIGELSEDYGFQKMAHPVLKIILKQGYSCRIYEVLQKIKVNSITLDVEVVGMEALAVKNDFGILETEQNLQPFGFTPIVGANFYVHAEELIQKNVHSAKLHMHWKALPENFKAHYEGYKGETNSLVERKEDFKINIAQRKNKEWLPMSNGGQAQFNLFEDSLEFKASPKDVEKDLVWANEPSNGTIRITLAAPSNAFGHAVYPAVYTRAIMSQVQQKDAPIPNQPYTPTVETIQLSYEASEVFETKEEPTRDHYFFHIEPFGITRKILGRSSFPLISESYNSGGQLFLGIDQLHPPEQLNLFFEIKDEQILEKPNIQIAYLSTSGWKLFTKNQLLSDATLGLKQTGIITLNIPVDATKEGGTMPRGCFWIKLMAPKFPERYDRILDVRTNAVQCTLNKNNIISDFKVNELAAGTIKSLVKKNSQIKKIEQPYTSFGGEVAESDDTYFTRVSERLSHKNRGVTSWDIERLVLLEFPRIYQVICYPNIDEYGTRKAGHIHVVIIPKVDSSDENRIRKPLASAAIIQKVEKYLRLQISPHVLLSVGNPIYEELKISADISFNDQVDAGFYLEKLKNDIKKYLSPWAFDRELKIEMGTSFFTSSLIKFIELKPYINFVASVKVNKDGKRIRANEIKASSQAILISSNEHNLRVVEPNTVMCQTNQGVAQMIVDVNFQVE